MRYADLEGSEKEGDATRRAGAASLQQPRRAAAEHEIQEMAEAGVIEPSSTHTLLVKKKDDICHFCVDYRCLNDITRKDSYLLPRIDDAVDYIAGYR